MTGTASGTCPHRNERGYLHCQEVAHLRMISDQKYHSRAGQPQPSMFTGKIEATRIHLFQAEFPKEVCQFGDMTAITPLRYISCLAMAFTRIQAGGRCSRHLQFQKRGSSLHYRQADWSTVTVTAKYQISFHPRLVEASLQGHLYLYLKIIVFAALHPPIIEGALNRTQTSRCWIVAYALAAQRLGMYRVIERVPSAARQWQKKHGKNDVWHQN